MGASKGWLAWAAQAKADWLGLLKTAATNKQHQQHKGQAARNAQQAAQTGNFDFGALVMSNNLRPRAHSNMHKARASKQ